MDNLYHTQFFIPNLFGCFHKLSIVASPWQDLPTWLQLWHHVAFRTWTRRTETHPGGRRREDCSLDSLDSWMFWKSCLSLSLFVFIHRHSLSGMTLQFVNISAHFAWAFVQRIDVGVDPNSWPLVNEPFCTYKHRYGACALPVISSWIGELQQFHQRVVWLHCANMSKPSSRKFIWTQKNTNCVNIERSRVWFINPVGSMIKGYQYYLILKVQQKVWLVQPLICGRWRAWERAAHFLWTTRPFSVVCGESSDTNLGWTRWEPGNGQAARLFDRSLTTF